jgi:pimeloyl-ACP methyl ester carboxylesterase
MPELPQDKYVRVGNINTRYWMEGESGSDVLLIHGLGGSVENWVHNIRSLAEKHRVYAVDLLGFGRSDKKPLIRDLLVLVRFIRDFMDTLGVEKATLVGNSLGGGLVLTFAVEYPQRVVKLVLVDNAGMGRGVITAFKLCSLPLIGELSVRPSLKGTAGLWRKIVYDASLVTPELVDSTYRLAAQPGAKKSLLAALRTGINPLGQKDKLTRQLLVRLNAIKAPALVVWGKQDRIIPPTHAKLALEKIPGARLEFFDCCGHMPQLEYPDKFNKLVLDFLAES